MRASQRGVLWTTHVAFAGDVLMPGQFKAARLIPLRKFGPWFFFPNLFHLMRDCERG